MKKFECWGCVAVGDDKDKPCILILDGVYVSTDVPIACPYGGNPKNTEWTEVTE